jgi:hypothetical protein
MSSLATIDALNRLLTTLCRSFPQYLRYADPYIPPGHERVVETLGEIIQDQDGLIDRVTRMIDETGAPVDRGEFPMIFTDAHDLGIDFLVGRAIDYCRQDLEQLRACAQSLHLAPAARALAEEAVGMNKAHLEALEEVTQADRGTPAGVGTR